MGKEGSLVGYCGLYCGACAICQKLIKNRVAQLLEILHAYQFRDIAKEIAKFAPEFQHYPQFEEVCKGLAKMFGECLGCIEGGGPPVCEIRNCCKESGFRTCAECNEMPCEKLEPQIKGYKGHLETLQTIKNLGIEKWTEQMKKKVKEGFSYVEVMQR